MADVKIGISQTSKPAPLGYRRFTNAYTVVFIPSFTSLIMSLPFTAEQDKYIFAGLAFSVALVKGIGMILGNGQIYSPSNQTMDSK